MLIKQYREAVDRDEIDYWNEWDESEEYTTEEDFDLYDQVVASLGES